MGKGGKVLGSDPDYHKLSVFTDKVQLHIS